MFFDSRHRLVETDSELRNPETTAERVQTIFDEIITASFSDNDCPQNIKSVTLEGDFYVVTLLVDMSMPGVEHCVPHIVEYSLHFPKAKLSASQIERLEKIQKSQEVAKKANADKEADELILWAAGRAATIAALPIPLADVGPLMANEAYMIYRIAKTYGYSIDNSVGVMLGSVAGGSIAGKLGASFLPFLKVPIAAGITYAVGKAAKAYFTSGMILSRAALNDVFTIARKEADGIDWKENKTTES